MKPKEFYRMFLVTLLVIGLITMAQSKTDNLVRRQLDPYTQEKLQEEIKTKIEPLLEKKLQEIVNMPGNQELSKSQIRYLLQQSIKKIQPERFYVDKNEQAKNPSFIGYLSTEDVNIKPEEKDGQDPKDQFTLPVNFHIPTTKRNSDDLATSSQQYPDQLYHQKQFVQAPNNNNGYPQPQLIQNYPNILPLPPNPQQQNLQIPQNYVQQQPVQNYAPPQQNLQTYLQQPVQNQNFVQQPVQNYAPNQQNLQNFVQPEQNYVQTPQGNPQYLAQPQQYLTQQQYQNLLTQNQNLLAQNQQLNQPNALSAQNFAQQQNQQLNAAGADLPIIKPTTIPLAIPILQRFLERPQQLPLPEQLNIQQPQQPVPLPPQLYYNQQQGAPINGYVSQPQQLQQQQFQGQPIQQNQANGISLRADLKDNLFPDNEDQRYQQPVFSINEPPPPAEQQIENPPQQQGNIAQKYPLGPSGFSNQQQNQYPVNVQNLPLVNTQPVYSGQQVSQGMNQGSPYYSAQTYPQQGAQNQYGPQGPIPNYQDEQQQYDRPQEQYNAQNQGNGGGDTNQSQDQTTEAPIKYNINDELPPISNFQDLLKPPSPINEVRANIPPDNIPPQQYLQYRNNNPPTGTPDRLIYTTPNPQKYDDRIAGLRPSIQEMDPLLRGDPGYKPTGKPSPVITGLRDFNIIPIDLIHRNDSDQKLKYDLPNDLFTLPVHFATPNKTADYQKQRLEEKLKQNAQNIQSLYDLQQSNNQNNINDKNSNIITRNELLKRDHSSKGKITTKVDETIPLKPRSKRNYYYDAPKTPFNLPGESDPYSTPSHPFNTPSGPYGTPSHPFSTPLYYENIEYRYIPIYIPKPTDFFFVIRFCPVTISTPNQSPKTSAGTQNMTTAAVDTATKTTTSTPTTETMTTMDMATATPLDGSNDTNTPPSRCVWAIVSCCSPGMIDQRSECFQVLGCQGDLSDNPCAPDIVMNAVQQVTSFYQNTSDALLREDRTKKFNDADYDYDGGSNLNQLFYDDFEVPDNITVSPDTLTTFGPVSSEATRVVRLVQSPTKPTPKPPAKPIGKAAPKPPVKAAPKPTAKTPKPTAKTPVKAPVKVTVKPAPTFSTTKRSIKRETVK